MDRAPVRLASTGDRPNRVANARGAGNGVRTPHEWLAAVKAGREPFDAWSVAFRRAGAEAQAVRRAARLERRAERGRARWRAYRAAREGLWLRRLGPAVFWSNRLRWLAGRGRWDAYRRTVAELEAQGFRSIARACTLPVT